MFKNTQDVRMWKGKYLFLSLSIFIQPQQLTSWPKLPSLGFPASLFISIGLLLPRTAPIAPSSPTQFLASKRSRKGQRDLHPCTVAAPQSPPHPCSINCISSYLLTKFYLQTTHLSSCNNIPDSQGPEDLLKLRQS